MSRWPSTTRTAELTQAPSGVPSRAVTAYVFAYGSLIQRSARIATVPSAGEPYPVIVKGVRRGWFFQYEPQMGPTLSPTYLGAFADPEAECNGVLFAVPPTEHDGLVYREVGYTPTLLDPAAIEVLDGDLSLRDARVWYYAADVRRPPGDAHPIVQSYVDVCVGGCLEIEEQFPAAKSMSFARRFIETTDNWQPPWVNDRLLPWRPSVHEPRAWDIDELLNDVLGADLFRQIRVPRL